MIKKIQDRIVECMKTQNTFERDVLKTVLGEIQTIQSRTGKMDDAGVVKVFRKFKDGVEETIKIQEANGRGGKPDHLGAEIAIYNQYIPATMELFEIMEFLNTFPNQAILDAKSDGQATGIAISACKKEGLPVLGKDVAIAVKSMRVKKES